ncbi:transcriptional regulator (plasmid) [Chamaesiphon minutus PCC 6605]|uniref:Transcriptional regulator n=2 Tax=Chamaesiphon TaxID=217161 RepID=K9UQS2_CHAP6|nr:transcriptional regulator [Chamaesiphon minutus PCC 6605]
MAVNWCKITMSKTMNRQISVDRLEMDVSGLQIFVEVVRQGSFAAVARNRNLDPSSVSRSIASLEAELGIGLFQRTTRQLSLTEAGATYFDRIEPLIEEIQQATNIATDVSGQPQGTLRVTASVSFGHKCIVPLLAEFQRLYPDLTIDLLLADTVVDLVVDRIDLAVRLGLLADSTLIAQQLMRTHYSVCASPDYLKRSSKIQYPRDLEHHNCLLFPLAGFRSRWIFKNRQGELSEIPIFGRTVISSAIALGQCAIAGMGIALLPNWLIAADLRSGNLVDVFPDYAVTATDFNTAAWLVYPSRAYVPLKVRILIEFLKKSISGSAEV